MDILNTYFTFLVIEVEKLNIILMLDCFLLTPSIDSIFRNLLQ